MCELNYKGTKIEIGVKLGDQKYNQMCELNYKGTKIEIGVKLGDQKYNFTYKK